MADIHQITRYFPDLSQNQIQLFTALHDLYMEWNPKVNLISRKDTDHLYTHHLLHSLAIARFISFRPDAKILDVGTGGGLPGIPLAIFFPETKFHLVDSIAKKIKVVQDISQRLNLQNVTSEHARAEELKGKYDFVVSRAVTDMSNFFPWVQKNISNHHQHAIPNGILALKGGDLSKELKPFHNHFEIIELSKFFTEDFYQTKKLVHLF
jgi:16S rRNA (guanine527-N7)-methyltransferase